MVENFSEWFHEILDKGNIIDSRYPIKGMSVWLPYGFQIRKYTLELLKDLFDKEHEEVLFPLLVPEEELAKEGIHVKGFEEEVYWVTQGGNKELNEKLALRPTSETAIYPMFSLWIRSHIDLPMKYYQIVNTFRYETKHTRPLIRVREISTFKEAHTVHASQAECNQQVEDAVELYKEFFDYLGIPYFISKRPEWDKFPGADYTMAFDTLMPDGKTLQIGTVHNLGQTFAKTFDITFENEKGAHEYAYQSCYGLSDRVIATIIGVHGDEKGLVLPPTVSPNHLTIIPILFKDSKDKVLEKCMQIKEDLESEGIRVYIDDRDMRPGKKFFDWEVKGTPLRLEIGPKDLENNKTSITRRDTLEKTELELNDELTEAIKAMLMTIDIDMSSKAFEKLENSIAYTENIDEIDGLIKEGKVVAFNWDGKNPTGEAIEEETGYDILGIHKELDDASDKLCIYSGEKAKYLALIAKTY
ncbi:proline--tRNA ligase [Methanobrevibacter sp. DSM 116169]|uniref:proline--tRNA ligase n=1 Tax=Methanobrevibacter sp. DSM 116169 TaxID=3242727 RepID=UPI0038FCD89D